MKKLLLAFTLFMGFTAFSQGLTLGKEPSKDIKLEKGRYAKELAVDNVLERIRTGRFKVFNTCRKFMDEWRGYSRDDKGKIMKGRDHASLMGDDR